VTHFRSSATLSIRIPANRVSRFGSGNVPVLFGVMVRVQFGDCTLDLDTRELWRGGKPVHLEPKAYRLLDLLLAARPKALSKDELQDALWPKTFVSERSVARLIEVLRSELGDSAKTPRFIRTIHGFGYAFCGDVEQAAPVRKRSAEPDVHCRIVWGDRDFALQEGENLLGRDPEVTVWIDLNSVSRKHARILVAAGRATIEDLGSRNGTSVGGERISSVTKLSNGDKIKIGAASLVFRSFRGLGSTQSEVSTGIS
jgi:DNA-binding winged helix-turn-helix (wHTH) protein